MGDALLAKRLRRARHFAHLTDLIRDVPGDVVECGVGSGKSLLLLTNLTARHEPPRHIWGFDSFAGLPAPAEQDLGREGIREGKLTTSEQDVRDYLTCYGIPPETVAERITLVPGFFPGSFEQHDGSPVALLHLDVDLYQSYKDCLAHFAPLVVPGGVIAFDEYRHPGWPGATVGIEEHFGGEPPGIQQSPHWSRWYLVV